MSGWKAKKLIADLDELFRNVEAAFASGIHIQQVALIFGATVVAPKELYVVDFPRQAGVCGLELSRAYCIRKVFQRLVEEPRLYDVKRLALTNIALLIRTTRNCGLQWFHPHHGYSMPARAFKVTLELLNKELLGNGSDDEGLSVDDTKREFSSSFDRATRYRESPPMTGGNGPEEFFPLDVFGLENGSLGDKQNKENVCGSLHRSGQADSTCDLVWFQAPLSIKGFKYKTCRESKPEDIWV
ncbi:PREDICTED: MAD2L1-binding protein-like [Priapulus caudatus]|uniref:MAD2L1-binding protein-like n=1 Tax=Priapulus caudatus TaxID=37621 RepID=A0ABM1ECZ4_PRICU|nr:PREDICTED: MAD2L1-binding protein-like [Priapulus caudatus]